MGFTVVFETDLLQEVHLVRFPELTYLRAPSFLDWLNKGTYIRADLSQHW